jgi:hypothetical protein
VRGKIIRFGMVSKDVVQEILPTMRVVVYSEHGVYGGYSVYDESSSV